MNALNVLCAQLTRDLFALAKFLFFLTKRYDSIPTGTPLRGRRMRVVWKVTIFDQYLVFFSETIQDIVMVTMEGD